MATPKKSTGGINKKAVTPKRVTKKSEVQKEQEPFEGENIAAQPHSTGDYLITETKADGSYRQSLSDYDPTEDLEEDE